MKQNLLNVVIPTRNRPDTLYFSLKTVVNQDYKNLRIIVNNNSDIYRNEVREIIKSFQDSRIDYFETEGNLSMKDNYENALSKVNDGYVIFIGDDDGISYNSIKYINELINKTNSLALKCFSSTYRWKTLNDTNKKNTFFIYKDQNYTIIESQKFIKQVCYYVSFSTVKFLPNIYNGGVISLELINKIKKKSNGIYFNGIIQDVYSAIINCAETNEYTLFFNPIIISGISKNSTGISINKTDTNSRKIKEEFLKSNSKYNIRNLSYSSLNICLADSILESKKYSKNIPELNIKSLINEIIKYELPNYKNNSEIYNSIIKDLEIISKEFNYQDYLYEQLDKNNYNSDILNSYFKIPIKYSEINCNYYNLENLFDSSILCNTLISNKNDFIPHENLILDFLEKNYYYSDNISIFYNINDIYNINSNKKNIFFDFYQKKILNNLDIQALAKYDEIWVTNNYRKKVIENYNKNTKNIFELKENIFDKNKKTICITSLDDLEIIKNLNYDIMLSENYNEDNYYKINDINIEYFSLKKLDNYYNIIFLDFKIEYFNEILINLDNKCFIFPKNKYIENYKYLIYSIEIEDLSFIKNIDDILNLE